MYLGMLIQCPNCQTRYTFDERRFANHLSVKVRCGKCQHSFRIATQQTSAPLQAKVSTNVAPVPDSFSPSKIGAPQPSPKVGEATRVSKVGAGSGRLPEGKVVALSVTDGPQKGKLFRLDRSQVVIGRSGSDILIDDPEVSRRHCALQVDGVNAILMDLGTTNGTYVDGNRVATHPLHHLSEFRIGSSTLMFTVTNKAAGSE